MKIHIPSFLVAPRSLFAGFCLLTFLCASGVRADHVWINEFHYDNTGADTGEFVEIAVRSDMLFNPAFLTLTLYNGATGTPYGSAFAMNDPAFTSSGPFSITGSSATISLFTIFIPGLIDGSGGFSIHVNQGPMAGFLVQFLSYGGAFMGTSGPANGAISSDVGVTENDTTPAGASLGLTGTGFRASEFAWANNADDTPGGPNNGQTFVIPEPSTYALLSAGALLLQRSPPVRLAKKRKRRNELERNAERGVDLAPRR
jgi:hypothetical protein